MAKQEKSQEKSCKIVLLGNSGAGKTCILSKFLKDEFRSNQESSFSAAFSTAEYEVEGQRLRLDIWDTVGQEKFHSLAKIFYRDAAVAILVFSLDNKKSFDDLKDFWYNEVKTNSPSNVIIGIAANKCDTDPETWAYSRKEIKSYAKEVGCLVTFTSALNGTGIKQIFHDLTLIYLDPTKEYIIDNETITISRKEENEERKDGTITLERKNHTAAADIEHKKWWKLLCCGKKKHKKP